MISVRLDTKGEYQVRWPRNPADILQLGQMYTNYENSLPVNSQLCIPSLAVMQTAYTAAQMAQTAANSGEMARAIASETYRQTFVTVRSRLELALLRLKNNYISNLAQLEQWGLDTVAGNQGISVRKPKNEKEWVSFLDAYVMKETSLAVEDQITDPSLAEMTDLRNTLLTALTARMAGRNQREANIQTRTIEVQRLLDLLQAAAVVLVVANYNGMVTNDLQHWGYEVIAAASKIKEENDEEEEPAG